MRNNRVRRIIVSAATTIALSLTAVGLGAANIQSAGQGDWPLKPHPNSSNYVPHGQGDWPLKRAL